MDSRSLINHFDKARLPLELTDRSMFRGVGATDIVQLDVARPDRKVRHERFRLFPGAEQNRVEVLNLDRHLRQLVLLVHEPRRRFVTFVSKWQQAKKPVNAISETRQGWHVENFTSDSKRHFLAGKVRHPDHATLELRPWRRALANTEASSQPEGIGFVD